ncbi:MAG: tRNA (N6-isopentenyl adenosine(37)-C2)-methylthiotransferase MiaB [Pseudomonadota bacterium]
MNRPLLPNKHLPAARRAGAPTTFQVKSFGCQMNVYDGERMAEMLTAQGMNAAEENAQPDLVVLNTCHIREKAVDRVYSDIGRMRYEDGTRPMIAVAGCVAQAEGGEISRRAPTVDIVVGPQAYHHLPELIGKAVRGEEALDTDMPAASKFGALPARAKQARPTAFLTIQEGCDKFCTYCVVPYTRGAEISRPLSAILDEAKALIDGGVREVTLLGQNVNAWTGEDERGRHLGFDGLVRALADLPDLSRIRYMTSHPNDMTDGLISAHAEVPKLMPFLHLPVQSGSDRILKAMNRNHTVESYLAIIDKMRAVRPDIALSGDFIVGFPGESESDFEATMSLLDQVRYSMAYSFKYSPRPGTPATDMSDQISPDIMDERLQRLQARINAHQVEFNSATVGKRVPILLERVGRYPGQLIGKTPWLQSVHVTAPHAALGDVIDVDIVGAGPNSLAGELAGRKAA